VHVDASYLCLPRGFLKFCLAGEIWFLRLGKANTAHKMAAALDVALGGVYISQRAKMHIYITMNIICNSYKITVT